MPPSSAPLVHYGSLSALIATVIVYASFATVKLAGWLATNREKLRRIEGELRSWEERRKKALQAKDIKMFERVQREQKRIEKLKQEMEMERLKSSAAALLTWIAILQLLRFLTGDPLAVALPTPWGYVDAPLSAWFVINSFWASVLLDRVASFSRRLINQAPLNR